MGSQIVIGGCVAASWPAILEVIAFLSLYQYGACQDCPNSPEVKQALYVTLVNDLCIN